jgi:glycosyltransferase involved in cell wall biosynthesis
MSGRLRVLLVTHDASRTGAPRVAGLVAGALVDRGHRVSVVSLGGGPLLEELAAIAPTRTAPLIRARGRVRRGGRRLRRLSWCLDTAAALVVLATHPSDVVYVNSTAAATFVRPALWLRRRVVLHVHESQAVAEQLLAEARVTHLDEVALVACSPSTHADVCRLSGRSPGQVHLVPSVPDQPRVLAAARAGTAERDTARVVGACGSVNHRKGTDLWLEVAARVLPTGAPQTRFVWVGDLAGRPVPEHPPGVTFTGPTDDPYSEIARFDVATLPSRDDPFPLVVLEAMLLGVPVVAFDVGGVREQVGDTGLVVPPGDVAAFAQAVTELLDDSDLRARRGAAARQRVLDLYSVDAFGARVSAVVEGSTGGGE